jgi:hypothetical protein
MTGLNIEARHICLTLAKERGRRWSVEQIYTHWRPTFTRAQIRAYLRLLTKHRFVECTPWQSSQLYAYTAQCTPLPGEQMLAIAPPPQNDMLRAPAYQPAPAPSTRPGADDHKRHASHGVRC